jgi:hypothetical protein
MKLSALWRWIGRPMVKIRIASGADVFELETDAPLSDVAKYLDLWFVTINPEQLTQEQIDQLAARVAAANDALRKVVGETTPTP